MLFRFLQPAPVAYRDFCDAVKTLNNERYQFEPLKRIEGGILCSVRGGVAIPDTPGRHMTVRFQWTSSWIEAFTVPMMPGEVAYLAPPLGDGTHTLIFETTGLDPWTEAESEIVLDMLRNVLGWHELPLIGGSHSKDNRSNKGIYI